jgi:hypothetical protein
MKKVFLLFLIPFFIISCKKEDLKCKSFKLGKFIQNIEEYDVMVYSTRTREGFQRDSSKLGISKYKLTWKTDCELESKLVETTIESSKIHLGRKYKVTVIEVLSEQKYIYECKVDGIDFIDRDTIIKIK